MYSWRPAVDSPQWLQQQQSTAHAESETGWPLYGHMACSRVLLMHALRVYACPALCAPLDWLSASEAFETFEAMMGRRRISGPAAELKIQRRTRGTWRVDHIALGEG